MKWVRYSGFWCVAHTHASPPLRVMRYSCAQYRPHNAPGSPFVSVHGGSVAAVPFRSRLAPCSITGGGYTTPRVSIPVTTRAELYGVALYSCRVGCSAAGAHA